MKKEARVGIAVIAMLMAVFGYALYHRLKAHEARMAQAAGRSEPKQPAAAKPRIADVFGPLNNAMPNDALPSASDGRPQSPAQTAADLAAPRRREPPSSAPPDSPPDRYASFGLYGDQAAPVGEAGLEGASQQSAGGAAGDPFGNRPGTPPDAATTASANDRANHHAGESFDTAVAVQEPDTESSAASTNITENPLRRRAPVQFQQDPQPSSPFAPRENVLSQNDGALEPDRPAAISRTLFADDSRTVRPAVVASAELAVRQPAETYIVESNDNFGSISEKVYGSGYFSRALMQHNKHAYPRPELLRAGDEIATPPADTLLKRYAEFCPQPLQLQQARRPATPQRVSRNLPRGRTYIVEEGDTLFDIARNELGKAARWPEIYELNRDLLGDNLERLQAGTVLALPNNPAEVPSLTRRPNSAARSSD
jgi:nucleoid-associated protein YgaU